MNNYLKVLLYLKKSEGDGKLHEVESILSDIDKEERKEIFIELAREDLIQLDGGRYTGLGIIVGNRNKTSKTFGGDKVEYIPFSAKITFKGSKYLKEELQMQESGKYNIAVTGQGTTNNFVIESQNVTIDNKAKFANRADKIIDTINNDSSIDNNIKSKIINDLSNAKKQADQNGKVSGNLIKQILEYGSNISSIGQLVMGLFTR